MYNLAYYYELFKEKQTLFIIYPFVQNGNFLILSMVSASNLEIAYEATGTIQPQFSHNKGELPITQYFL